MIHFENILPKEERDAMEELAIADTVHETVRKAINCCDGEDTIVLSLNCAMALIMEWDELVKKNAMDSKSGH